MTGQPLTDTSLMLFGKYQGYELKNVPARYMLWILANLDLRPDLKKYIEERRERYESEVKKANWEMRR
jgi:hypothetical protein